MKLSLQGVVLPAVFALGLGSGLLAARETSSDSPSHRMHMAMQSGEKDMKAMKMTGDADHDFAMMMSMHHKSGVAMADIEAKDGKDEKMRDMARKIAESQRKEIAEFEAWMKEHKPAAGGHQHH